MATPRHLFLTGDTQVGKSTLIRHALAVLPGLRIGGFCTLSTPVNALGAQAVYIVPADSPHTPCTQDNTVGMRSGRQQTRRFPGVFDTLGASLLNNGIPYDVLVMDEIGTMEHDAAEFQAAVLCALDGPVPVLGVLKQKDSDFLRAVRAHPAVRVLTWHPQAVDTLAEEVKTWVNNLLNT